MVVSLQLHHPPLPCHPPISLAPSAPPSFSPLSVTSLPYLNPKQFMANTGNPDPSTLQESDMSESPFTPAQILQKMFGRHTGIPAGGAAVQSRSEGTCEPSEQFPSILDNAGYSRVLEGPIAWCMPSSHTYFLRPVYRILSS